MPIAQPPSFDPVQGADVFDIHAHIIPDGCLFDYGTYEVKEHLDRLAGAGIRRGAVFSGRSEAGYVGPNAYIARQTRDTGLIAFARIGLFGDGYRELEAALESDIAGFKVHTRNVRPDAEKLRPLFDDMAATGLPVLFHSDVFHNSAPNRLAPVIDRHGWAAVIVAHCGKSLWPEAVELARDRDNVVIDTSIATYYQTRNVLKALGPEKVVFGTDEPYGDAQVERLKVEKALEFLWPGDEEARAKVMGATGRRILNLPLKDD